MSIVEDLIYIRNSYRVLSAEERAQSPWRDVIERYNSAAILLDPVLYRIYTLYYVKGLSQESVAAIIGSSRKYVWDSCVKIKKGFQHLFLDPVPSVSSMPTEDN